MRKRKKRTNWFSFLLGEFSSFVLRILAAGRKFSRKLSIRSTYGTAASIRISYTLAIFLNFADVYIFQKNFRTVHSLILWGRASIRIIFQELFCRNLSGYLFCMNLRGYLFSKNSCLKKIVGIKTKIYL